MTKAKIKTPYPSLKETAHEYGESSARAYKVLRMVQKVPKGSSTRSGRGVTSNASAKKAKKK